MVHFHLLKWPVSSIMWGADILLADRIQTGITKYDQVYPQLGIENANG